MPGAVFCFSSAGVPGMTTFLWVHPNKKTVINKTRIHFFINITIYNWNDLKYNIKDIQVLTFK